jgi:very-short-patch-repair endonuclease
MNHQKTVTPQALRLSRALNNLDVKHDLEYDDGYKHVDIAIESAKLYLELDGTQHAFSPKQMCADDERDRHSQRDGYYTKRISNAWVDQNVDRLAASIAILVNKRQYEIRENEKKHSLTGIMKSVLKKLSKQLEDYE